MAKNFRHQHFVILLPAAHWKLPENWKNQWEMNSLTYSLSINMTCACECESACVWWTLTPRTNSTKRYFIYTSQQIFFSRLQIKSSILYSQKISNVLIGWLKKNFLIKSSLLDASLLLSHLLLSLLCETGRRREGSERANERKKAHDANKWKFYFRPNSSNGKY